MKSRCSTTVLRAVIILNIPIIVNIKILFASLSTSRATADDLRGRTRIIHSAKIIQICQIIVDKIEILLLGMQKTGLSRSIFQGWGIWNMPLYEMSQNHCISILMTIIFRLQFSWNREIFINKNFYYCFSHFWDILHTSVTYQVLAKFVKIGAVSIERHLECK